MKCNIVRDLFPLYLDGLCSEETRKQLDEHNDLRDLMNQNLDKLTEWDYYVTDISFHVKEYDKMRYLYRYQMDIEPTNQGSMDRVVVSLDCYRISENFIYIDGSDKLYHNGNDLPPEVI